MNIRPAPLHSVHESAFVISGLLMPPALYAKNYLSVPEQVRLLRARGMTISDEAKAEVCLHRIGYYRLSGYFYPFRQREILTLADGSTQERIIERFRPDTDLATVMDLYVFDKRLRLLFLDAIERIEIGLRVETALILGRRGALSYRNPATFNNYFSQLDTDTNQTTHQRLLEKLDAAYDRSREEFAEHFKKKYASALPIWMSIELWDFGTLSTLLQGMQSKDIEELSAIYGLSRRNLLPSWAQSINFVRNVCAHHGRLWNRPLVQQPIPTKGDVPGLEHLSANTFAQRRLYAVAAVLQYLMRFMYPASTWGTRLQAHMASFPATPHASLWQTGFPEAWWELQLWQPLH
jgi:abortive infection bacteriophage resistance protein